MSKDDEERLKDLGSFLVNLAKRLKSGEQENQRARKTTEENRDTNEN